MTSTKNWPLLWKVQDHIETHPEDWDQSTFGDFTDCGTPFCFAGHAVILGIPGSKFNLLGWRDADDNYLNVDNAARKVLGLSFPEADELFYNFTSDPDDIRSLLQDWADEEVS